MQKPTEKPLKDRNKCHVSLTIETHSIKQHQPLLVLTVRHKSEAINAAEQNVSGLRVVLQARLSWGDGLHRPNLDQCIC